MPKYLVYKTIMGRVAPEIWHDKLTDGNEKERTEGIVQKTELEPVDYGLSFNELVKKYPYEEKEQ